MSSENSKRAHVKQEITRQVEDLAVISLYLAFFFCAVATYKMLLLNEFHISYFDYGAALINALLVGKVILIGEDLHLGRKQENKPLFLSVVYKAVLFGLLVFGFHIVEEVIKRLLHGENVAAGFHNIRIDDLLSRSVVIFCTFLPLFGFLEVRRVLGEDTFRDLFFRTGAIAKPGLFNG